MVCFFAVHSCARPSVTQSVHAVNINISRRFVNRFLAAGKVGNCEIALWVKGCRANLETFLWDHKKRQKHKGCGRQLVFFPFIVFVLYMLINKKIKKHVLKKNSLSGHLSHVAANKWQKYVCAETTFCWYHRYWYLIITLLLLLCYYIILSFSLECKLKTWGKSE